MSVKNDEWVMVCNEIDGLRKHQRRCKEGSDKWQEDETRINRLLSIKKKIDDVEEEKCQTKKQAQKSRPS